MAVKQKGNQCHHGFFALLFLILMQEISTTFSEEKNNLSDISPLL